MDHETAARLKREWCQLLRRSPRENITPLNNTQAIGRGDQQGTRPDRPFKITRLDPKD